MNYLSFLLLPCLWVATAYAAVAQEGANPPFPKVNIQSPNAASLEKYGEIPVSYHTGIPEITVPLYEITEGTLTLPIYLSYHASGLKVLETASWVGAGWTLMAGGAITRTVQGLPDDNQAFGTGVFAQNFGHYSDRGYNTYIRDDKNENHLNPDGSVKYQSILDVARGHADGEPDRYYINVNGYSGKFYFNDDQQAVFEPASDVKVIPYHTHARGFYQWEVILPDGTRYTFGQEEGQTDTRGEKSYPFLENQTGLPSFHAATTSWLLTKITSADGKDVIRFKYVEEKYGYHTFSSGISINSASMATRIKNSVAGWRLSEIVYTNGSVHFAPAKAPREDLSNFNLPNGGSTADDKANTGAYALGEIAVADKAGTCRRKFVFITN